jgi:transcriptional regulator of heat shock response
VPDIIIDAVKERTSQILESIVREFINSGEPISSEHLYDKYGFGVKPATIRAELAELTDLGFLDQEHPSAGRIPSNKGYEFYAELVFNRAEPEITNPFTSLFEERAFKELTEALSEELNLLGVLSRDKTRTVYKDGLDRLFENLEWESDAEVKQIIHDFEGLDERVPDIKNIFSDNFLEVFIGKKSPVTESNDLAVIMGDYVNRGERMFLLAIGPKRMDYEKPLRIFRGLKQIMQ